MKKYFMRMLVSTFIGSCMVTMLALAFMLAKRDVTPDSYACDLSGIVYGIAFAVIVAMSVSSRTVFLNLEKNVRSNITYSFAYFFALPVAVALLITPLFDFSQELYVYASMCVPFFVFWLAVFVDFRRSTYVTQHDALQK